MRPNDSAPGVLAGDMYRLLSGINRALVRAESPDRLYDQVCRLAVESGLFELAWIGLLERDTGRLRPMASCGDRWGIAEHICQASRETGQSLGWRALRDGQPLVCHELAASQPASPGVAQALAQGLRAMTSIPLREGEQVIGLLELYGSRVGCFDADIIELLDEVAGDISFALEHLLQQQQRLAAEARVRYLAYYDPQTGLPGRALLAQRLPQLAASASCAEQGSLALLDIHLQRLDLFGRVHGQAAVDLMLRVLAQRLEDYCAGRGMVAQLSQDEFAVAIGSSADPAAIQPFAAGLLAKLLAPLPVSGGEAYLNAVVGVAVYPSDGKQLDRLLSRARAAATDASANAEIRFYRPELERDTAAQLALEGDLHRALERSEFMLHYQPQLNMRSGAIVGAEALLRWQHPVKGTVAPASFIPLLESCGLMPRVGAWALREACMQQQRWVAQGLEPLRMAVNLSAQQFRSSGLVEAVERALADSGMAAEWLELELTESLILEDAERTIAIMHELKALGVTLSLDDFGTGYSSLSYLRRFPIDRLKIDRSFVRDVATQGSAAVLARTILAMAHNLGLATIAEGVEDASQFGYLRKYACEEMQGYLFTGPLPAEQLGQWLREERRLPLSDADAASSATVLVVDDDLGVIGALKRLLRREGIAVLSATSAAGGFELLATTAVGVIISDQRMPGVSGSVFLEAVRELHPDSIRILLTGYTELESVIEAINRGTVYKVLTKPWDDKQLADNVREALKRYETLVENRRLQACMEQARAQHPDAFAA
ncbi:EAL domain-containing protein [Paucibacter soli]|uniref:EAL domain-containing protein n=1 Tax=Paucibacter soli TaxID=3133433 RepID=UPI00309BA3C3